MHYLQRIRTTSEHEVRSAIELLEKRRAETSAQGTPVLHLESTRDILSKWTFAVKHLHVTAIAKSLLQDSAKPTLPRKQGSS
ncbi:hypothetical protein KIN20_035455 [Parelaphostrongylus tenuis]|nr:hypothetical protein KIN20_035001 [Parelaphostrongylus tenuis]KAJ1373117.1 hypothetical protein KIN20_035453 [Parelaphostrongylus tenuis]KAJ1373119.1 hypothetical protein KIN20_035455 [Parelaphostrongylus tenuis]